MLQQYNVNIQDEEWGQHIHIDNDFTNLKFINDLHEFPFKLFST